MSTSTSYVSCPTIHKVFSDRNHLYESVKNQVLAYVSKNTKSDQTYLMWAWHDGSTQKVYMASMRIILDIKTIALHPITSQSTYALKCLLMTNIVHNSKAWQLLCKVQDLLDEYRVNYIRSYHSCKISSKGCFDDFTKDLTLHTRPFIKPFKRKKVSEPHPDSQTLLKREDAILHFDSLESERAFDKDELPWEKRKRSYSCSCRCIIL